MKDIQRRGLALAAALWFAMVGAERVQGESLLLDFATAGTRLQADMTLAYEHNGIAVEENIASSGVIEAHPHLAPVFHAIADPPDLMPPASSDPHDLIRGGVDFQLDYGQPVPGATWVDDTFLFNTRGEIGAVDTAGHAGLLDGYAHGYAKAEFFVETAHGANKDDPVGLMVASGANLGGQEGEALIRFTHLYFNDDDTITWTTTTMVSPTTGMTQTLLAGSEYWIEFEYEAFVPHGSAISYDVTLGATIIKTWSIPEPGAIAFMGFGLLGLGLMRRRRKRGVVRGSTIL